MFRREHGHWTWIQVGESGLSLGNLVRAESGKYQMKSGDFGSCIGDWEEAQRARALRLAVLATFLAMVLREGREWRISFVFVGCSEAAG
jgi:hypothetical protein